MTETEKLIRKEMQRLIDYTYPKDRENPHWHGCASVNTISVYGRCTETTARRYVKKLVACGFLEQVKLVGKAHWCYRVKQ